MVKKDRLRSLVFGLFVAVNTLPAMAQQGVPSQFTVSALPNQQPSGTETTPTLSEVLALARARAPELQAARAEVEASRSALVGAKVSAVQNPYLEVIGERGGRGVTRDVYVTAQLHTPIEVAGQRGRRIAEADSFVDWHSASLGHAEAQLSGAVVRNYGQCVAWSARLETLTQLHESALSESRTLSARRDAGDATERDAQLAEVERARISALIEETNASLGAALNELSRLTGRRFGAPDTTHVLPQIGRDAVVRDHASQAPAVKNAEAEARYYSRVDERLERDRIPPVTVILQAGRGDWGETRLGAGLAWSLPVFRYSQGERARAQAESTRARATASIHRSSIAQRLVAITEEGARLRAAVERLDLEAIPAATRATDSAVRMQRAGKTDLLSVVVARRDLHMLRLRRLEIAERVWSLLGDWVELTGQLPK